MFAVWKHNCIKKFCEVWCLSGLPQSPKQIGSRGQALGGRPGGPGCAKVLVIFKDQNQHSEVPFLFLRIFYYHSIFSAVLNCFLGAALLRSRGFQSPVSNQPLSEIELKIKINKQIITKNKNKQIYIFQQSFQKLHLRATHPFSFYGPRSR